MRLPAAPALAPMVLWLALQSMPAFAQDITGARYDTPTERYPHGALGDPIEHERLVVDLAGGASLAVRLPQVMVFEDTAPRLADVDGDGAPEIVTVESHAAKGARLAIWAVRDRALVRVAATPYIGRRFRWLAPVGAADLDGDGRIEIAYVETPHLGKTLKIVRLEQGRLVPVGERAGLTNHRNGSPEIEGGIATCDGRPTILTADADWRRIVGTRLTAEGLSSKDLAPYGGPESFADLPGCN